MYLWAFLGAFGDIVNAWIGWAIYHSTTNDWAHAFGPATPTDKLPLIAAALAMLPLGYRIQKRLYRPPLSPAAYAILATLLLLLGTAYTQLH